MADMPGRGSAGKVPGKGPLKKKQILGHPKNVKKRKKDRSKVLSAEVHLYEYLWPGEHSSLQSYDFPIIKLY